MIEVQGLEKSFEGHMILHELDLTVSEGDSLVIIGASGGGKSVLIRCMLGIMMPDLGSVQFYDDEYAHLPIHKRKNLAHKIGVLFQESALFDSLTVWENIMFKDIQNNGMKKAVAIEKAEKILEEVGLSQTVVHKRPAELSGGMKRRVAFARTIVNHPSILFCDEPTTGLDPITSKNISKLIRNKVDELNVTVVTITHDIPNALVIGDKIAMLHNGRIIWSGDTVNVFNSGNEIVEEFISPYKDMIDHVQR